MPTPTPKQMLAEHLYTDQHGDELGAYVAAALANGKSWRYIAADVSTLIGVTISRESLRLWYGTKADAA